MLEELKEGRQPAIELTLTVPDFKKSKVGSNEIYFNGKMYDIKSISFIGDSVKLKAIDDVEEKKIVDIINALSNNMNDSNRKLPLQIHYLTLLKYISSNYNLSITIPSSQINIFYSSVFDLESTKPDIKTPPPQLV